MESDFDPETADIIAWGISPDGNTPGTVIYWLTRGAKNLERIEVPATAKWGVVRDGHTVAVAVGELGSKSVETNLIKTFATHGFADEFAARLREALNNPCEWIAERWDWSSSHTHGKADPLVDVTEYDSLTITKVVYAELKADAERYRQLAAGEIVDGHILINRANTKKLVAPAGMVMIADSTYRNLTAESARLHQLLNGKDVDGKRLLPVSYVQSMARMESALGHVLGVIDDNLQHTDVDKLGFTLDSLDW